MVSFEPLDVQDRECVLRVPGGLEMHRHERVDSPFMTFCVIGCHFILRLGRCDTANGHIMCSEKVEELPFVLLELFRQDPSDPVAGVKLFQALTTCNCHYLLCSFNRCLTNLIHLRASHLRRASPMPQSSWTSTWSATKNGYKSVERKAFIIV